MNDMTDAELFAAVDENDRLHSELKAIHDLLPTCPTCGGSRWVAPDRSLGGTVIDIPCPDCTDGHVPLARLVALWEAVQDDKRWGQVDQPAVIACLRSVTPT